MAQLELKHRRGNMMLLLTVSVVLLLAGLVGSVAATDYTVAYGETVKLHVGNPFGGTAYLYIQGTNFPFQPLKDSSGDQMTVSGKGRTVEIETVNINGKRPDAGTYTIYVSNKQGATSSGNLASENGYWDAYTLTMRPIGVMVN
ncbi:MAG TPA: hypothetical protein O0X50_04360, partial [Methanocorpusculum sp.]|nr:hypothetical protein [Methanocorpusculum sp.]